MTQYPSISPSVGRDSSLLIVSLLGTKIWLSPDGHRPKAETNSRTISITTEGNMAPSLGALRGLQPVTGRAADTGRLGTYAYGSLCGGANESVGTVRLCEAPLPYSKPKY